MTSGFHRYSAFCTGRLCQLLRDSSPSGIHASTGIHSPTRESKPALCACVLEETSGYVDTQHSAQTKERTAWPAPPKWTTTKTSAPSAPNATTPDGGQMMTNLAAPYCTDRELAGLLGRFHDDRDNPKGHEDHYLRPTIAKARAHHEYNWRHSKTYRVSVRQRRAELSGMPTNPRMEAEDGEQAAFIADWDRALARRTEQRRVAIDTAMAKADADRQACADRLWTALEGLGLVDSLGGAE